MKQMENKKVSELTSEELKQLLAQKEEELKKEHQIKRDAYVLSRNKLVSALIEQAKQISETLTHFKKGCMHSLENHRIKANEYGDIRSNSKGGFGIRNNETGNLVRLERNVVHEYDERAQQAELLIKEFLEDKVKKKDLKTFKTITALLSKNKAGDFNPSQIANLLKVRDNYNDDRWTKAMQLFEEAYVEREISWSVSFFTKNAMGKDEPIVLSFPSIPVAFSDVENREPVEAL